MYAANDLVCSLPEFRKLIAVRGPGGFGSSREAFDEGLAIDDQLNLLVGRGEGLNQEEGHVFSTYRRAWVAFGDRHASRPGASVSTHLVHRTGRNGQVRVVDVFA
jgi:hypothetical protein